MSSKTKIKKSSNQKFYLNFRKKSSFNKNLVVQTTQSAKQLSKINNFKQNSLLSFKNLTPSKISKKDQAGLTSQYTRDNYLQPLTKIQHNIKMLALLEQRQKNKKRLGQNIKSSDYEYNEFQNQKISNNQKWIKKNYRGSLVENQIFNQYGYSRLSHDKIHAHKTMSNLSNKKKRLSDKQQIQRLLLKYANHIEVPSEKKDSKSKNKNFRTLSTDDKSQKKLHIIKKIKNRRNNENEKIFKKDEKAKNQKVGIKSNCKRTKSFKKKSSKSILPEYFGFLSINKVESKLQTMRQKKSQKGSKDKKYKMNELHNELDKKGHSKMQLTKIKQEKGRKRQEYESNNKETKRNDFLKSEDFEEKEFKKQQNEDGIENNQINLELEKTNLEQKNINYETKVINSQRRSMHNERSTVSPIRKKSQKTKNLARQQKESKKQKQQKWKNGKLKQKKKVMKEKSKKEIKGS